MPRDVVLYQLLSLDGVAEEPGDWMSDSGPEVFANLARSIESQVEPFASFISGVRKHVVTSSEPAEQWANSTLVTAPVEGYVEALKNEPGGDIGRSGRPGP